MPSNLGTWNEWARFVIEELKRLDKETEDLDSEIKTLGKKIVKIETELRIKSGVWGLLGGIIPSTILIIVYVLKELVFSK